MNKFMQFPKDNIKNLWYRFVAYLQYIRVLKTKEAVPPKDYELVFESNFKSKRGLEKDWSYGQPWGEFHPDSLRQWYDTDGTLSKASKGVLKLSLMNTPKHFVKSELPEWQQADQLPDEFTIPSGIGIVVTKGEGWKYGWFEAEVKLPVGEYHWPAFWLTGVNSWPPEIDILEAYTKGSKMYGKKLQPNIHFKDGENKSVGAYDVRVKNPESRFVKYACHWTKDFVEIYYDNRLVMKYTNKDLMNKMDDNMMIILNHGTNPGGTPSQSTMEVKNVKVYQSK